MVLLHSLNTSEAGLTGAEAARRLTLNGPNRVGADRHASDLMLLARQFSSPIVLLLAGASVLSLFLGDAIDSGIILVIVLASAALGFIQERGAVHAVRALLASVEVHADVIRDGVETEVPLEEVVTGDIVVLRAGDVIPADSCLLTADDLHVDESALTGESYPVHKRVGSNDTAETAAVARRNYVFLGTHVVSGYARAVVSATGSASQLGIIGTQLNRTEPPTTFERGLRSFGYLLMRVGALLVVLVFGANLAFHRPVLDSLLFSLALAIGITPQLLPAVVTLTLSRGAREMAREQVIVKRLSSIEDFGGIDVLCVDKTGTLTVGAVRMEGALDVTGRPDPRVAKLAWQNARHQDGFSNPIDQAILASAAEPDDPGTKIAEVPYDFTRKRLSVALRVAGDTLLVTKGALASVRGVCSTARLPDATVVPISDVEADLDTVFKERSRSGLRILGIALRALPVDTVACTLADEDEMTLVGLITFADPPKPGARATLDRLEAAGVAVKMITGDNRYAAQHVAEAVGLGSGPVMTGDDIHGLDDDQLVACVTQHNVFAETAPADKERIVRALSVSGHSVGFLGDGINDALAIRAADVGISVDTAVDVAKESAAIVLLDKDLDVLLAGIRRGRQSFANTLKYVFVTTSANFGNMVSMAGATLLLPFLPLLPRQILLLNFMSDIPATTIANDSVDAEQLAHPSHWDIHFVRSFMIVFGLVSSAFDYLTFAVLRIAFPNSSSLFRTGWFIVSVTTELLVMLILRTRRPFLRSRPSAALLVSSALVAVATLTIPFTFAAHDLGFERPPARMLVALAGVLIGYIVATEAAKRVFYRRISMGSRLPATAIGENDHRASCENGA
jgi:Mg2+-importing ATPase